MVKKEKYLSTSAGDREAVEHFKQTLASGKHWYIALLETIGLWTSPEEVYKGRRYRYIIGGQAFDWLLLAERLCREVDGLLPEQEVQELLFSGQPPIELSEREFEALIGSAKYRAFLNYYYGVVVERALLLAVEEEIAKERRAYIYHDGIRDSYSRIYGADEQTLLRGFREEKGYSHRSSTISELWEFTYWLFKYRLRNTEPARVASDTKKALAYLERLRKTGQMPLISLAEQKLSAINWEDTHENPVDTAEGKGRAGLGRRHVPRATGAGVHRRRSGARA